MALWDASLHSSLGQIELLVYVLYQVEEAKRAKEIKNVIQLDKTLYILRNVIST